MPICYSISPWLSVCWCSWMQLQCQYLHCGALLSNSGPCALLRQQLGFTIISILLSSPGIILGMGSANERKCYIVTSSLIGWAHTQKSITPALSVLLSYPQICDIRPTLVGYKIVFYSDVVGASPVCAAPTRSSFSTLHLASIDCAKTTTRWDERHLSISIWCDLY